MNALFALAASGISSRHAGYKQIQREWALIDRDKIAVDIDMDDCFFEKGIGHRGFTGARYLLTDDLIRERMQDAVDDGMFMADFPATLAKEKTQSLLRSKALGRIAYRENSGESFDADDLQDVYEEELGNGHSRLQAFYVGDWLDIVEDTSGIGARMMMDIIAGNTDKVLSIIRDLQNLPDYSEYAPNRRPPGAHKKDERKSHIITGLAVPQPIR